MSAIHDGYLAAQPPAPPPIPRKYRQPSPQLASSSAGASSSSTAPPPLPSRPESSRTDSIRPLPPRPGPPQTAVPAWDPETKSHIPAQATIDAREQSYATHAQPPPRLREAVQAREAATRDARPGRLVGNAVNGVVVDESTLLAQPGRAPRGVLEGPVISGEWWLDPALARVPQPAPRDDGWLKRLGKRKESKAAAGTSPTAVFRAEKGNIDARMNVVVSSEHDSVAGTHAHVVVENKRGHVRVEVASLDAERGIDLHVKTRSGNIFLLLPANFQGRIECSTSSGKPVALLPALSSKIELISWSGGQFSAVLGSAAPATSTRRTSGRLRSQPPAPTPTFVPLSTTLAEHAIPDTATTIASSPSLPGSISISSLSGHVTLGLFGQEPQRYVGGTMSQLLAGLSQVGGELKRMWKER